MKDIIKVGIALTTKAYMPEAYAYRDYLTKAGFQVKLDYYKALNDVDIKIRFMGIALPGIFSHNPNGIPEIHEYASLSVPPFGSIKDIIKARINRKPVARIFQNPLIKKSLPFNDQIPWIFRDMGVDKGFFTKPNPYPEFDLVYCGAERIGLDRVLKLLGSYQLKILVIGKMSKNFISAFDVNDQIVFYGSAERNRLPALFRNCRLGLNFTPNNYPFNYQTSTKTLEYCAAGLGIISNRYYWVEQFEKSRKGRFLWLENIHERSDIEQFEFTTPDVQDLEWNKLLDKASFGSFIRNLVLI